MKHAEYSCLLLYVAASEQTSAEFVIVFADLFASEADNLHVFVNFTKHLAAPQTYEPDGLCVCVWVLARTCVDAAADGF